MSSDRAACSTLPRPVTSPKPGIHSNNSTAEGRNLEDTGPPKPSLVPSTGTIKRGPPTPKKRPPTLTIDRHFKVPPLPSKTKNCKAPPTPNKPVTPISPVSPNKVISDDFRSVNVSQLVRELHSTRPSTPTSPRSPSDVFLRSTSCTRNITQKAGPNKGPPPPPKKMSAPTGSNYHQSQVPVTKVTPLTPKKIKVPPPTPVKVNNIAKGLYYIYIVNIMIIFLTAYIINASVSILV